MWHDCIYFCFSFRVPNLTALVYVRDLSHVRLPSLSYPQQDRHVTYCGYRIFEEICFGNKYTLYLSDTPAGPNPRWNTVSGFVLKMMNHVVFRLEAYLCAFFVSKFVTGPESFVQNQSIYINLLYRDSYDLHVRLEK
jgi:hypothetical protein